MDTNVAVLIPSSVENLQLPAPELVQYYNDVQNRVFWIDSEIDSELLDLVKLILQWNAEDALQEVKDRKPIKLFFFSPGGDLEIFRTLADVISMSRTPVIGVNFGMTYSAAAMIFLSCHKRLTLPSAYLLFHCGSSQMSGSYAEVSAAMDKYANDITELALLIEEKSTYTREEVVANMAGDWYVDAKDALEHQLVHEIVEDINTLL